MHLDAINPVACVLKFPIRQDRSMDERPIKDRQRVWIKGSQSREEDSIMVVDHIGSLVSINILARRGFRPLVVKCVHPSLCS